MVDETYLIEAFHPNQAKKLPDAQKNRVGVTIAELAGTIPPPPAPTWDEVQDKPVFGTAAEADLVDLVQLGGQAQDAALEFGTTNAQPVHIKTNGGTRVAISDTDVAVSTSVTGVGYMGISGPTHYPGIPGGLGAYLVGGNGNAGLTIANPNRTTGNQRFDIELTAAGAAFVWRNEQSGVGAGAITLVGGAVGGTASIQFFGTDTANPALEINGTGQVTASGSYVPGSDTALATKKYVDDQGAAQRTAIDALSLVATADATDLPTAIALANANKVAINAIIDALKAT
ncbi:hypothetical protein GCM10011491_30790 [Brucella endophytica]|uniref:Uncharacterized protein n=1 Tax=Brucella endophytica TaxID=1963359 RepID=A0A916SJB1_9HYPH|nr:hypothetical protein [Brucella endophytica]GGB00430.1 hypothetical protein GCM10011491_30790 [Brucella endophytica]